MRNGMVIGAVVPSLSLLPPGVEAKACLKGAAVGGVAGHMVGKGHAVAGAAAGCAIGHHHASKQATKAAQQNNNGNGQQNNDGSGGQNSH